MAEFRETMWFMQGVNPEMLEQVDNEDADVVQDRYDDAAREGEITEGDRAEFSLDAGAQDMKRTVMMSALDFVSEVATPSTRRTWVLAACAFLAVCVSAGAAVFIL